MKAVTMVTYVLLATPCMCMLEVSRRVDWKSASVPNQERIDMQFKRDRHFVRRWFMMRHDAKDRHKTHLGPVKPDFLPHLRVGSVLNRVLGPQVKDTLSHFDLHKNKLTFHNKDFDWTLKLGDLFTATGTGKWQPPNGDKSLSAEVKVNRGNVESGKLTAKYHKDNGDHVSFNVYQKKDGHRLWHLDMAYKFR